MICHRKKLNVFKGKRKREVSKGSFDMHDYYNNIKVGLMLTSRKGQQVSRAQISFGLSNPLHA